MKYRFITVAGSLDSERLAFKRVLIRSAEPPVRIAVSKARDEISATIGAGADMVRVKKCLRGVGLQVVDEGESES